MSIHFKTPLFCQNKDFGIYHGLHTCSINPSNYLLLTKQTHNTSLLIVPHFLALNWAGSGGLYLITALTCISHNGQKFQELFVEIVFSFSASYLYKNIQNKKWIVFNF